MLTQATLFAAKRCSRRHRGPRQLLSPSQPPSQHHHVTETADAPNTHSAVGTFTQARWILLS